MAATHPLSTFTAPASCATSTFINQIWTGAGYYLQMGPRLESTDCFPNGYTAALTQAYSPGTACPTGYTTACRSTTSIGTVSETAVTCCPTGISFMCMPTTQIFYPWQQTLGCTSNIDKSWSTSGTIISNGKTFATSRLNETTGGIGAHSIQIRFQQTDMTPPTTTSPTAKPTTTSGSQAPSQTSSQPVGETSAGLTAGAAAGIAVGAIAGIAILGLAAFVIWRRKRRARAIADNGGMGHPGVFHHPPPPAPLPTPKYTGYPPPEMEGMSPPPPLQQFEMPANSPVQQNYAPVSQVPPDVQYHQHQSYYDGSTTAGSPPLHPQGPYDPAYQR